MSEPKPCGECGRDTHIRYQQNGKLVCLDCLNVVEKNPAPCQVGGETVKPCDCQLKNIYGDFDKWITEWCKQNPRSGIDKSFTEVMFDAYKAGALWAAERRRDD